MRLDSPVTLMLWSGFLFCLCTLTVAFRACESPISFCIHVCRSILHQIWPKSLKKLFVLLDVILHLLSQLLKMIRLARPARHMYTWTRNATSICKARVRILYSKKQQRNIQLTTRRLQKNCLFPESFWRTVRHRIRVPSASHKQPPNMTVAGFPPHDPHDYAHTEIAGLCAIEHVAFSLLRKPRQKLMS